MSNADVGWFLRAWRAGRVSAGSKIAATPAAITEQALCLAGMVWGEAVRAGAAGRAVIGKAWREGTAREEREINGLDTAARVIIVILQKTLEALIARIPPPAQ